MLGVLITSTLPLLVLRGVFQLTSRENYVLTVWNWGCQSEDAFCMMMSSSYGKKRSFYIPLILRQSVHLCSQKDSKHGEWFYIKLQTHLQSLRERTPLLFAISDKHSGRLLNFLCCFLYLELGLSWVIHAWTSDFKLFQENENLELSLGWGICARFWSPSVGWLEFLYLLSSSLILLNPIQTNFPVYHKIFSKRVSWLEQNTWKFCTEPLLMVYKVDWVYLFLCQRPICKTGSKDVYFKGSCLMSFERILKHCGAIIAS